jgi:hypothetical protein
MKPIRIARAFCATGFRSAGSYWLCRNAAKFLRDEEDLPVDQHMLPACIAQRPLYVGSRADKFWADPRGEYLSASLAGEVYRLPGKKGLTPGHRRWPAKRPSNPTSVITSVRAGAFWGWPGQGPDPPGGMKKPGQVPLPRLFISYRMMGTAVLLTGSRRRGDQKRTAIPALRRRSFSSNPVAGVLS